MIRKISLAICLLTVQQGAFAQQDSEEWQWSVAPYLWAAGITGDVRLGTIESDIDIDFSDIADVLAGAVLLHVETQNDRHGFFGDLVYMALEPDDKVVPLAGNLRTELDSTILELGYQLKVMGNRGLRGLEFGIRYWDFETSLQTEFLGNVERSRDWTDVFVGWRRSRDIGVNWRWVSRMNIGAGGSDFALGLQSTFLRELNSGNAVAIGLKTLTVEYEKDLVGGIPFEVDTSFAGATIGFVFH